MATGQTARNAELPDEAALDSGLSHLGFFYRDQRDYLARIEAFTSAGHASGEPVFIAVPGDKVSVLRERLGGPVRSADMAEMGRNPARIIPEIRDFIDAHPGKRVRYVGEPVWPGRSAAEMCEVARHEALINLAFTGMAAAILALAASEIAANTLQHTSAGGTMHIWHTGEEILCQIRDQGWITDPLAGRTRRPPDERGHGLWVVNQVCDLVELRTGPAGTTFRLHMNLREA